MKILFDASSLNFPLTGIGYYSLNLLKAIVEAKTTHSIEPLFLNRSIPDTEAETFCRSFTKKLFYQEKFDTKYFRRLNRLFFPGQKLFHYADFFINLPFRKMKAKQYDIFHGQDLLFNKFSSGRITGTIHDLTTELFPQFHAEGNIIRNKIKLEYLNRKSRMVVCVSESTRNDLIRFYPEMRDRSKTIYQSCHPSFERITGINPGEKDFFMEKHSIPKDSKILLSVCTIEPRKNLNQVLNVFTNLKREKNHEDLRLVLVGYYGWNNAEFDEKFRTHPFKSDIFITGYLSIEEIILLYKSAEAFIYPSLYEGFGLPVLEAMKSGCPVISSNVSSIPEVAGNAALLCDPNDTSTLSSNALKVLTEKGLRDSLIKRGLERGKFFSWGKAAKEQLAVYENLF